MSFIKHLEINYILNIVYILNSTLCKCAYGSTAFFVACFLISLQSHPVKDKMFLKPPVKQGNSCEQLSASHACQLWGPIFFHFD